MSFVFQRCFLVIAILFISNVAISQEGDVTNTPGNKIYYSATANGKVNNLNIYSGREYYHYFLVGKSMGYSPTYQTQSALNSNPMVLVDHPFYQTDEFLIEKIVYDDVVYYDISLLLDICKDEVVVLTPEKKMICLSSTRVTEFTYLGRTFSNLSGVTGLEDGFYEIKYKSSDAACYSKHRKKQTELWRVIDRYYVVMNEIVYPIKSKRTFLKLVENKNENIRELIRKNNLNYRDDPGLFIATILEYLDSK